MGWNTDINEVETFTDPAAEGWVLSVFPTNPDTVYFDLPDPGGRIEIDADRETVRVRAVGTSVRIPRVILSAVVEWQSRVQSR